MAVVFIIIIVIKRIMHCKKSSRSSSTPASGHAGPIHTGVKKSFRHPRRKFYYKYRTFPTFFTRVVLVRQSWKVSKAALSGRKPTPYRVTICHSTTAPHFLVNSFHNNTFFSSHIQKNACVMCQQCGNVNLYQCRCVLALEVKKFKLRKAL
jgi:hypothetical protein